MPNYVKKNITTSLGIVKNKVIEVDDQDVADMYIDDMGWSSATETEYNTYRNASNRLIFMHTKEWKENPNYGESGTSVSSDDFINFGELPDLDTAFYSFLKEDSSRLVPITCVYSSTFNKYIAYAWSLEFGTPQKLSYLFAYNHHNINPEVVTAPNSAKLQVFTAIIGEYNKKTLDLTSSQYNGIVAERNAAGGITALGNYTDMSQARNPDHEAN